MELCGLEESIKLMNITAAYVKFEQPAERVRRRFLNVLGVLADRSLFASGYVRQLERDVQRSRLIADGCIRDQLACASFVPTEIDKMNSVINDLLRAIFSLNIECLKNETLESNCVVRLVSQWQGVSNKTVDSLRDFVNSALIQIPLPPELEDRTFHACGFNRTCRARALFKMNALDKFGFFGEKAFEKFQRLRRRVEQCYIDCAPAKVELMLFTSMIDQDRQRMMRVLFALQILYCSRFSATNCSYLEEFANVLRKDALEAVQISSRLSSSAPTVDPSIAVAGLVFACLIFVAAIAVFVLGLVWRTVWSRAVWPMLLGAIVAIAGVRIGIWSWSLSRQSYVGEFQMQDLYPVAPVIGATLSIVVSLVFCLVSLLVLYLFVVVVHVKSERTQKVLTIMFVVLACVLVSGAIVSIACSYAIDDVQTDLRFYFAGPIEGWKFGDSPLELRVNQSVLVVFVPILVFTGLSFLLSATKFVFALLLLMGLPEPSHDEDRIRHFALKINVVVFGLTAVLFLVQLVCVVLQLPSVDVYFPELIVGVGTVGMESGLLLSYLALVFVAWRSSQLLTKTIGDRGKLLSKEEDSDNNGVPMQYRA